MLIKTIIFINEVKDVFNDNIDVGVDFEDGYSYTIVVGTPADLLEEIKQEKTNFIRPGAPMIIVKKLTEEIGREAIHASAENDGYWLKLHQFADDIDTSVFNKLEAEQREEWGFDDLDSTS